MIINNISCNSLLKKDLLVIKLEENSKNKIEFSILDKLWLKQITRSEIRNLLFDCVNLVFKKVNWNEPSEINFVFSNDMQIRELNNDYRKKDAPTNVLSFPQIEFETPALANFKQINSNIHLGDIVLSIETMLKESIGYGLNFRDHTVHIVVHGVLHLLGFDHINDDDAFLMEGVEVSILSELNIDNPYV